MEKDNIVKLENYIFKAKEKPRMAAQIMADLIGVLIGLKPAMIGSFKKSEFDNLKIEEFKIILDELGLKCIYFEKHYSIDNKIIMHTDFCIARKAKLAEQTHKTFTELWSTMNNKGEILDHRKWVKTTKKIGKLLGYPKTAVIDFIKTDDIENKDRIARMERNRYYAHSAKYEDKEFKSYDQKLNRTISNFAPKTTAILTKDKGRRWLE